MTRYVIKRVTEIDVIYWCGQNYWTHNKHQARRFLSQTEAELAAVRELPDRQEEWVVEATV